MILTTFTQSGLDLSLSGEDTLFKYSRNLQMQFIKDENYSDYTLNVYYELFNKEINKLEVSDAGVFTLDSRFFEDDRAFYLSFSLSKDETILHFKKYKIRVGDAVGDENTVLPEKKQLWIELVENEVDAYFQKNYQSKLDDFEKKYNEIKNSSGTGGAITVDTTLSSTSTNPVQNKVITTELSKKLSTIPTATSTTLGGVKPVEKTSNMTQNVGVDSNGVLFTLNKYAMQMRLLFEETAQGVLSAKFDISAINLEKKGKLWVDIEFVGDATLDDDIFSSLNDATVNVVMFENYIHYFDGIRITKAYSTGHVSFIIEYDFDTPVAYVYGTNGIFSLQRRYSPLTGYDYKFKLLYGVNMRNTGELNVRLNVKDSENASKALKSINVKIYKL